MTATYTGNSTADDDTSSDRDPRITAAIKFMRRVSENDSVNRANAKAWRRFRWGEQWPAEIMNSRTLEQRPCITVNKTAAYCRQVENQQRQQRPRIKVDPTGGGATKKSADVIKGMIRHIETNKGGADMAYDHAFSCALTEGAGYWRVLADYSREDSFEQELYLMPIEDPGSVYYDDHCVMPDGSDAEEVLIVTDMAKDAFKRQFPDADPGDNFRPTDLGGFNDSDWMDADTVRIAEYFTIEHKASWLIKMPDGTTIWEDQLPKGIKITDVPGPMRRKSAKKQVKWCKLTAVDVVEEQDLPGKWIPVFRVLGETAIIDGKKRRAGIIKDAQGPAMMSNFWKTAMTETVALAPKAKWVMEEGQIEGHENEWAAANISSYPVLQYKGTNVGGQAAAAPERQQPEPPPAGAMAMVQATDQDLTSVLGIVDPAMRIGGNVSGKALNAERQQSDNSTFHFYDNLMRTMAHGGRYLVDVLPPYYSEPGRVVRIIGDDGKATTQAINQPDPEDPTQVINDVTVGEYAVVMDTGPGFNTKRQEAVTNMMPLFEKNEELMKTAGDIMFRNMDFPGADTIADRLAAGNPLSQVDETSDIPPGAQMKMKAMQQQIQQLTQHAQMLEGTIKSRADVESVKQIAETHRTMVKETAQTDRNNADNEAWRTDIHTKAHASIAVAEINQAGKIIAQTKDHAHQADQFERSAAHEDAQMEAEAKNAKKDQA